MLTYKLKWLFRSLPFVIHTSLCGTPYLFATVNELYKLDYKSSVMQTRCLCAGVRVPWFDALQGTSIPDCYWDARRKFNFRVIFNRQNTWFLKFWANLHPCCIQSSLYNYVTQVRRAMRLVCANADQAHALCARFRYYTVWSEQSG